MKVPRGARLGAAAPAVVEARLRPKSERVGLSDDEYLAALQAIQDTGRVPEGWDLQSVRWGHFTVKGEETDSFRFRHWQAGSAVDLSSDQGLPAALFEKAAVGIERLETERVVERRVTKTVTVREWTGHWRSTRTGRYVKSAYAKRYRHLVEKEMETRRVRKTKVVREKVPVEEAVIRFTYEAGFSVAEVPEVGQ